MGFDRNKANWSEEELEAAEAADKIYEAVAPALADGIQPTDWTLVGAILGPVMALFRYLAGAGRKQFARRLIAIGVILERDNELLDGASE